ncbi:CPBP family intramembrane glutamic endopeptidase [Bacteroidota bacterium]
MDKSQTGRLFAGILLAAIIFLIAITLPEAISEVKSSLVTHTTMFILSLVFIILFGKGKFSDYGFRRGEKIKWLIPAIIALSLGAVSTLIVLIFKISGINLSRGMSFPEIILYVWIVESICEEVLMRGFLQSFLSPLKEIKVKLYFAEIELPVFIAAVCFSLIHLIIIRAGADVMTVILILIFTFCVGILAGIYRSKSGSLFPAIILHMLANVGGVLGGIIYGIAVYVITGNPPDM